MEESHRTIRMAVCTSNAKKALVQSLVDFNFLFSMIFLIFFAAQATPE
jgi:hypothetical protein